MPKSTNDETISVKCVDPDQEFPWNALLVKSRGRSSRAWVDEYGRILAAEAVACVWSGTERFDGWIRDRYSPFLVVVDGDGSVMKRIVGQVEPEAA